VAEKIICGIEWRQGHKKRYIEDRYVLEAFLPNENELPEVVKMIEALPIYQHGPGFEIRRGATIDGEEILYRIKIWDKWVLYGSIAPKDTYK
jgi:hypothetical protein